MPTPIEEIIQPENYQGATHDFARFCIEEWERKQFSSEPFEREAFIDAALLILDRLVTEYPE